MTAHRPAQVARHAAVVLAGAASLSLTAAAGAYVVQQIADSQRPDTRLAAPTAPETPHEPDQGHRAVPYPALTGSSFVLPAAVSAPRAAEPETSAPHIISPTEPTAPTAPAPIGGKVRLGDAYVGAQVAEVQHDTVSVTVDTNAFTMLTDFLHSEPAPQQPDESAVTTMRTDVDTRSGEVRLAFSDPKLGEHDLRLDRHAAPAATPSPDGDRRQHPAEPALGTANSVAV
ncbi:MULTISPECIES: hypothetical protein [Nocardia]|uniref:hypothetical protein n=1 Tax=Nocardia TaxID=1817 RepID=UPI0013596872|nr:MULTISPECIES: hypothetical protein [Nocardia]